MKIALSWLCCIGLVSAFGPAQKLVLKLDHVAARAKEKAEVDLDSAALQVAAGQLRKQHRDLFSSVTELHVRHYEFDQTGQYSDADLEHVRKQVGSGTGWSRIVNVKDKDETVEVHMLRLEDKMAGLLVIAAEPKELSVVYLLGQVGLDQLTAMVKSNIVYHMSSAGQVK